MSRINFDNKTLNILDHGDAELRTSLIFAFSMFNISKIKSYRIGVDLTDVRRVEELELSTWDGDSSFKNFPFPVDNSFTIEFVSNWLKQVTYPDDGGDYDITTYKGFKISCHEDTIKIKPAFAMYGK